MQIEQNEWITIVAVYESTEDKTAENKKYF